MRRILKGVYRSAILVFWLIGLSILIEQLLREESPLWTLLLLAVVALGVHYTVTWFREK